jgi:hypothetical protein
VHTLRRWFLEDGEYVHPVLRWAAWPLFRVVMLVFVVAMFTGTTGNGWTTWKVIAVALLGASIVADIANDVVLRRRRAKSSRMT